VIDRRSFLTAGVTLMAHATVAAQPASRILRIGWLDTNPSSFAGHRAAFLSGLRRRGWVLGETFAFEWRQPRDGAELQRFAELAADLVAWRPDVIASWDARATRAAADTTRVIPIVFARIDAPVEDGLVESLRRPGGNLTGVASLGLELVDKRLELVRDTLPDASRIALFWDPDDASLTRHAARARRAAERLQLSLQVREMRAGDLHKVFAILVQERTQAVLLLSSDWMVGSRTLIAELSLRHRLPIVSDWYHLTRAGGLMSYRWDDREMVDRLAGLVDRILRGARPADLPVEQPTRFELAINLRTVRALGLTIPPAVLARADEVIEQ
jgi:putative ABC transport system substrate-binding protein